MDSGCLLSGVGNWNITRHGKIWPVWISVVWRVCYTIPETIFEHLELLVDNCILRQYSVIVKSMGSGVR